MFYLLLVAAAMSGFNSIESFREIERIVWYNESVVWVFFFLMRSLIERSLLSVALLCTDTCCFSVAVYRFSDRKPKPLSLSSGFFTSAFENEPQFKISPPTALLAFTLSTLFMYRNLTSQKGHQVLRLCYFVKRYQ